MKAFPKHHGLTLALQQGLEPFTSLNPGDVLRFRVFSAGDWIERTGTVMGPLRWPDHVMVRGKALIFGAPVHRRNLVAVVRRTSSGARLWLVQDARGVTVGQCQTRAAADKFVRGSLNTEGWTVKPVRV